MSALPINKLTAHEYSEASKLVLRKALLRMTERLALTRSELSEIIGVSEASLSRVYEGKRLIDPHSKEGELAAILLRLYRSLDTLFGGNVDQCKLWLRSPNTHLHGIPAELIKSVQGLVSVVLYLDAMRGKV